MAVHVLLVKDFPQKTRLTLPPPELGRDDQCRAVDEYGGGKSLRLLSAIGTLQSVPQGRATVTVPVGTPKCLNSFSLVPALDNARQASDNES